MDFTFSDEQEMLRASARDFLAERYPIERVAEMADGDGFDREGWAAAVQMGWTGISTPEEEGGAGLGFLEEMLVAEETGRALYPGPFLSAVVLALPALRAGRADGLAHAVVTGERIATLAWVGPDGSTDPLPSAAWEAERLTCRRVLVPDLPIADLVVVAGSVDGEPMLWAVDRDADGAAWRELPSVDATRRQGELTLDAAPAQRLGAGGATVGTLRTRALAALAAEACGVAEHALDLAVAYARDRKQFGRPIGSYQAVSHELARAYQDVETARSLTYWAGWAVAEGDRDATVAAAAAKARAAEAAVATCERALQAHGGIGFTWEHPLHRLYKRALGIAATLATADVLWARVADETLRLDEVPVGGSAPTIDA